MARPRLTESQKKEFLPIIAQTFSELGYRRTTTAELAARCGVRENILYRLWNDKKDMFLASIENLFTATNARWNEVLEDSDSEDSEAQRILEYEAKTHGEEGFYRITFAGLSESDDPDIRKALSQMYKNYHRRLRKQVAEHRGSENVSSLPDADLSAWAFIALGTVANICRELGLLGPRQRRRLIADLGRFILDGETK